MFAEISLTLSLTKVKLNNQNCFACEKHGLEEPRYNPDTLSLLDTDFLRVEIKDSAMEIVDVIG